MKDTISAAATWDFNRDRMAFLAGPGATRPAGALQPPAQAGGPTVYTSDSLIVQFTVARSDLTGGTPLSAPPTVADPGPTVGGYALTDGQSLPPVLPGALHDAPSGG